MCKFDDSNIFRKINIFLLGNVSLQSNLIRILLVVSAIPILIMSFFSYYNMSNIMQENTNELTMNTLEQTSNNLHIALESYEDLLYQIYTDDDVVALVDNLNQNKDAAVSVNQLRRYIREVLNTKKYIRSIDIITSEGLIITYDQLSSSTNINSWIKNYSLSKDELFEKVSADNNTHIFPTEYGTNFANEDYYLFHMAHRIIDYKNLNKNSGIVIVSIDEEFLQDICLLKGRIEDKIDNFNFIVDENGRIISFISQEELTQNVVGSNATMEERQNAYTQFIENQNYYEKEYISLSVYQDENLSWDIVNVSNQSTVISEFSDQWKNLIITSVLSTLVAIALTLLLSRQLTRSIKKVVTTMQGARLEDLTTARVEIDELMPVEIELIALQFNDMLGKLETARENEREAGDKQRIAEIKALEAQINPHFLYNTLDTINWMAIDKDEFDISNAISSLATILRYAITNSNEMVSIRDEMEWLKKYIFLQQTRLKCTFYCNIDVAPEVMEYKIYKLILQPFIENAIIHGFKDSKEEFGLEIVIKLKDKLLHIVIKDNGKGIDPLMVEAFNRGIFEKSGSENHIGIENVITRLKMYYGNHVNIIFESVLEEGTKITVIIPGRL